jgi:hypothetical protein
MDQSSVSVTLGFTMNLGNFESLRMDYSFTDKIRNYETPEDAFARVEAVVEQRLQSRLAEEREDLGKS